MYKAVGDLLSDLTSGISLTVGGSTPPPPTAGAAPNPIYCPEQAALQATAAAMFPNNQAQQFAYLLTNGPGLATPGGWAGWCALKKAAAQTVAPSPQPAPMPVMAMQTVGTTPTTSHWTTYAAIGAGVLGVGALAWYLVK